MPGPALRDNVTESCVGPGRLPHPAHARPPTGLASSVPRSAHPEHDLEEEAVDAEAAERKREHRAVLEAGRHRELDALLVLLHSSPIAAATGERADASGAVAGPAGIEDRDGELEQPSPSGAVRGKQHLEPERLRALGLRQIGMGEAPPK